VVATPSGAATPPVHVHPTPAYATLIMAIIAIMKKIFVDILLDFFGL
jgi:hypothetical protein